MSAARRDRRRQDWPRGLYEPRPGYYVWRHPETKQTFALGAIPLAHAKHQAAHANAHLIATAPSLVDRLEGAAHTVAELLGRMPEAKNANTAKSRRSLDKAIREALGEKRCGSLTVGDCADLIEELADDGKGRWAQAIRSRLIAVCKRGMRLGWMEANPAEVTDDPSPEVRRKRLSLEQYRAVYDKAPQVAEWLQHAMNLALVTGQDRSTVVGMTRDMVKDGHLIVQRSKTKKTNAPVAIPLALRMGVVGLTLAELCKPRTLIRTKYLVHHITPAGRAPAGSSIHPDRVSHAFTEARKLAGIPDDGAPTFHEIRSLCKRLYKEQGDVDTKALLGHATEKMERLYEDTRDMAPVVVKLGHVNTK